MTAQLSRRFVLGGLGGSLLLTRTGPASAAGQTAFRAIRQFSLGDMTISIIDDGSFSMGLGMFASNMPRADIQALFRHYGLPTDKAVIPLQVMLVESDGERVLIDTGMGDTGYAGSGGEEGRLAGALASLGLGVRDIDKVIITHGHPDHVGGLSSGGQDIFTAARHFLPEVEFKFWTQDPAQAPSAMRTMIAHCRERILPVEQSIRSYGDGQELAPGITAVAAPGHTHGHFAVRLESRGESLLHLVDTSVHYLAGLEHPDWSVGADLDKPLAIKTRKRLLAEAAETQTLVAGYHFPFPGVGRVMRYGDGFRYVPMPLG